MHSKEACKFDLFQEIQILEIWIEWSDSMFIFVGHCLLAGYIDLDFLDVSPLYFVSFPLELEDDLDGLLDKSLCSFFFVMIFMTWYKNY